jgi:hypothetical protein
MKRKHQQDEEHSQEKKRRERTQTIVSFKCLDKFQFDPPYGTRYVGYEIETSNNEVLETLLEPVFPGSSPLVRLVMQYADESSLYQVLMESDQNCCEEWNCYMELNGERPRNEAQLGQSLVGRRLYSVRWGRFNRPQRVCQRGELEEGAVVDLHLDRANLLQVVFLNAHNGFYPHEIGFVVNGVRDLQSL